MALAVDSLGPRGRASGCGSGLYLDQAFDAHAALRFLSTLAFVDGERVALIGQSMGGSAVLVAVERDLAARFADQKFRAAIAFLPRHAILVGGCHRIAVRRRLARPLL